MAADDYKSGSGDSSDDGGSDYSKEFADAVSEAFPDDDWDDDKLSALKEAIRICVENDEGGGSAGGKHPALALIFGGKPKD